MIMSAACTSQHLGCKKDIHVVSHFDVLFVRETSSFNKRVCVQQPYFTTEGYHLK